MIPVKSAPHRLRYPFGMTIAPPSANRIRLFLAGDVMLGRGIDQILPQPSDPVLYEGYMRSAKGYVDLAERHCGKIPAPVAADYVWGDLLSDLADRGCDARLLNLETAVTTASHPAPKGIHYRMHPGNIAALQALQPDACILANNHVLDWGREGLLETLQTLSRAGLAQVGAGETIEQAEAPLVIPLPNGQRLLLLAFGRWDSGVPDSWAAGPLMPGVAVMPDRAEDTAEVVRDRIDPVRRPGDILVVSLHWGGNWGYDIAPEDRALAHALIDEAGADVVFGHSSHHPKAVELHDGKLILYGCGDLINDYEGIGGHDGYRPALALACIADLNPADGTLVALSMIPYRIHAFRLQRAGDEDARWLAGRMNRECGRFDGAVTLAPDGTLSLSS
ncbi:CapA family protein [Thalassovita aquimarina]|nr:CapA family protein [Thalassovita aquimarina]